MHQTQWRIGESRSGTNVDTAKVRPRKLEMTCVYSPFLELTGHDGCSEGETQTDFPGWVVT